MALELIYVPNSRCVPYCFWSLTRLKGSWGQLWPKTVPKQQQTKTKIILFPRGLTATKCTWRFFAPYCQERLPGKACRELWALHKQAEHVSHAVRVLRWALTVRALIQKPLRPGQGP